MVKSPLTLRSLPRNFQDAITVTRLLGIRYLWIDSLCIIQDDKTDWEKEGSKMDRVYKNAYVTIAATSAATANDGFLAYRFAHWRTEIFMDNDQTPGLSPSALFLQEADDFAGHECLVGRVWQSEYHTWNTRAWTLQERYLSKRILHFCKHQIYWECRSQSEGETGEDMSQLLFPGPEEWIPFKNDLSRLGLQEAASHRAETDGVSSQEHASSDAISIASDDSVHSAEDKSCDRASDLDSPYKWWTSIVQQYSPRNLTYPSDKLPALSGLAAEMVSVLAKRGVSDTYLAGLWQGDFAQGLLWLAFHDLSYEKEQYTVPSWSWTSSHGPVSWSIHQVGPKGSYALAWDRVSAAAIELVSANTELAGSNPYGQVTTACLQLKGRYRAVTMCESAGRLSGHGNPTYFPYDTRLVGGDGRVVGVSHLDRKNQVRDSLEQRSLYWLQIEHQVPGTAKYEDHWSGLIIEQVDGEASVFRRMGVCILYEEDIILFDSMVAQTLTLV